MLLYLSSTCLHVLLFKGQLDDLRFTIIRRFLYQGLHARITLIYKKGFAIVCFVLKYNFNL